MSTGRKSWIFSYFGFSLSPVAWRPPDIFSLNWFDDESSISCVVPSRQWKIALYIPWFPCRISQMACVLLKWAVGRSSSPKSRLINEVFPEPVSPLFKHSYTYFSDKRYDILEMGVYSTSWSDCSSYFIEVFIVCVRFWTVNHIWKI